MANETLSVFISYSRQDEGLKDELVNYHLKLLQRDGKINTWQDRDIEAGAVWEEEIRNNLDKADIILMLITRHFLASEYCYAKEMMRAIKRHQDGTARVISIILSPCTWQYTPFQRLQVLPKDGKPVTRWTDKAEAFVDVELGIRRVVDSLIVERQKAEAAKICEAEELKQQQETAWMEQERQEREKLAAEQSQREQAETQWGEQAAAQRQEQERLKQTAQQTTTTTLPLKNFEFEVVTLNNQGQEKNRTRKQAQYFSEDLGNDTYLDLVAIPGGSFMMGSASREGYVSRCEQPQHRVTIKPFHMGKFPITQAQWKAVALMHKVRIDLKPYPSRFKGDMQPVENISWEDAVEFCQRLSIYTKRRYRLPSEAEWEYACRAGTTTDFHFGSTISPAFANCKRNAGIMLLSIFTDLAGVTGGTTEVDSFNVANLFGLYDMHGNVWEWCQDTAFDSYIGAPTDGAPRGSQNADSKYGKVVRGGAYHCDPDTCRSARKAPRGDKSDDVGFRVVCVPA